MSLFTLHCTTEKTGNGWAYLNVKIDAEGAVIGDAARFGFVIRSIDVGASYSLVALLKGVRISLYGGDPLRAEMQLRAWVAEVGDQLASTRVATTHQVMARTYHGGKAGARS